MPSFEPWFNLGKYKLFYQFAIKLIVIRSLPGAETSAAASKGSWPLPMHDHPHTEHSWTPALLIRPRSGQLHRVSVDIIPALSHYGAAMRHDLCYHTLEPAPSGSKAFYIHSRLRSFSCSHPTRDIICLVVSVTYYLPNRMKILKTVMISKICWMNDSKTNSLGHFFYTCSSFLFQHKTVPL